ncbi:transposase [Streptomyces alanosinicus]|uniref:Transposase n=1 Tax=Streptomyces alanosinicus TaxID=68171 RepID=A0A918YSL5_9ACTN|nr:transposase [Streptomyces alanosinicus]GHE14366.1 hypothetical protein GCM10010339_84640 [Streptomyces alanosinicus]
MVVLQSAGDVAPDDDGCHWDSTPHDPVTRVGLQGVGHIKVHRHRQVAGNVKSFGVKWEVRRWYVILTAEQVRPEPPASTGSVVGIDLGTADFPATSNGGVVPNPRHEAPLQGGRDRGLVTPHGAPPTPGPRTQDGS